MSTFEEMWMDQLAAFEQKLAKGLSYRECLQIQMDILENSNKYVESLELHLKEDALKNCDEGDILDDKTEGTEEEHSKNSSNTKEENIQNRKKERKNVLDDNIKQENFLEETIKNEAIMEENIKKENILQEDIKEEKTDTAANIKIKNIIPNYESKDFQCSICHNMLRSKHTLKIHCEMNHIGLRFHCLRCDWSTKERYPVRTHLLDKHDVPLTEATRETGFECGVCSFKGSEEQYEKHILSVHPEFGFTIIRNKRGRTARVGSNSCEFCGYKKDMKSSMAKTLVNIHIAGVHMRCKYKCGLCGHKSTAKVQVYSHIGRVHSDQTNSDEMKAFKRNNTFYVCSLCEVEEDSYHKMLEHMKLSHLEFLKLKHKVRRRRGARNEGVFQCGECDYNSNVYINLQSHLQLKHISSEFVCQFCKEMSSKRSEVVSHIRGNHAQLSNNKSFGWSREFITNICKTCGFEGSSKDYDAHLTEVHKMPSKSSRGRKKRSTTEDRVYACTSCESTYITRESLKRHIASQHTLMSYTCKLCDKTASSNMAMYQHLKLSHGGDPDRDATAHCGKCKRDLGPDLRHKHLMREHREFYSNVKKSRRTPAERKRSRTRVSPLVHTNYFQQFFDKEKCSFCQIFVKPSEEDGHILAHHLKGHYLCAECVEGRPYTKGGVLKHLSDHHGHHRLGRRKLLDTKVHIQCGVCEHRAGPLEFGEHTQHHAEEFRQEKREYQVCHLCEFKHLSSQKLKRHLATVHHLEPYSCSECGFRSKTLQENIDHFKADHPDSKFQCDKCEFSSTHIASVYRHVQQIHDQHYRFSCTFCQRKFKRAENLRFHSKKVHGSTGGY